MKLGYFDDDQREFVITRPDTPLPWVNYLGSHGLFGLITNTACGSTFFCDTQGEIVKSYQRNLLSLNTNGRHIFLRNQITGEVWSPTGRLIQTSLDDYICRHGLGYTIIESLRGEIRSWMRFLIPLGANVEVWQLRLTNRSEDSQRISAFAAVEFSPWDPSEGQAASRQNLSRNEVEVEKGVIYHKTEHLGQSDHFTFFASFPPPIAYDTSYNFFLGPHHDWDSPAAVENGQLSNSLTSGSHPVGVFQIDFSLHPGETRQAIFLLGFHESDPKKKFDSRAVGCFNKESARPIIELHLHDFKIEQAFRRMRNEWTELLDKMQVRTPDPHTNRIVNIWNPYQCMFAFNLTQQTAYSESSLGVEEDLQWSLPALPSLIPLDPKLARERILDLAAAQISGENARHQSKPIFKEKSLGEGTCYSDSSLWLSLAVSAYLKETGDFSILEASTSRLETQTLARSLFEHLFSDLCRSADRFESQRLQMDGGTQQNDHLRQNEFLDQPLESKRSSVNKDDKIAETFIQGMLYTMAFSEMAEVAKRIRREEEAEALLLKAQRMEQIISENNWDEAWFLRRFDPTGEPGLKDKVGIFSQTSPFIAIAAARFGYGDRAFDTYLQTNPSLRYSVSDTQRCEPYVYTQCSIREDSPTYDNVKSTWLTTFSAWSYIAITQWILGIRPTLDGLKIEPVIPSGWAGFSAERVYRGVTYWVKVERASEGNRTVLTVDGKEISGNVVPLPAADVHEVRVKVCINP